MTSEQELSAYKDWPETDVCRMLAARIRKARQELRGTQAEFA